VSAKLRQTPLQPPWFGLVYTLDLGSLGALSGSRPLTLTLLAGWGIGKSEEDMPAYLGLKLPGGRGTSIQWPLQGVLKLGFRRRRAAPRAAAPDRAAAARAGTGAAPRLRPAHDPAERRALGRRRGEGGVCRARRRPGDRQFRRAPRRRRPAGQHDAARPRLGG